MKMKKILLGTCSAVLLLLAFALALSSCPNPADSDKGKLTVSYNANGQNVTVPKSQKVASGGTVNVAALQGYNPDTAATAFNGWNTEANASGDLYTPGYPITVTEDITLYAMWNESASAGSDIIYEVKMDYVYQDQTTLNGQSTTVYMWRAYCVPEWLTMRRVELNNSYTVYSSFKSDTSMFWSNVCLADTYMREPGNDNPYRTFGVQQSIGASMTVEANKVYNDIYNFRYEDPFHDGKPAASTSNAELANVLVFWGYTTVNAAPTLSFSELTIKKDDPITLTNVTANGSNGVTSTQLYLTFDKPLDFLIPNTISIPFHYGVKVLSCSGAGTNWIVDIDIGNDETSLYTFDIKVSFEKQRGYNLLGERTVTLYTGSTNAPPAPIYRLGSVTANGGYDSTTTQLTLVFSYSSGEPPLNLLTRNDIYISGVSDIVKGTLSPGILGGTYIGEGGWWTHTLQISGHKTGGQITVSASKPGVDIQCGINLAGSWPKTTIYKDHSSITYTGFVGKGYHLLNGAYYNKDDVKLLYALNMPRVIGEGLYTYNGENFRSGETSYVFGKNIGRAMKSLSTHAKIGGSVGFFSASAEVNYHASSSKAWQRSFATSYTEIIKVREYLNISYNDELVTGNFLNPAFVTDLQSSMSPEAFFNKWGTHILGLVDMGGRLDMSYVYDNAEQESESSLEVKVRANYGTVSGEVDVNTQQMAYDFRANSSEEVKVWGGSSALNITSFAEALRDYKTWSESIEDTNNLTIVCGGDYDDRCQLIPVWDLIDGKWSGWQNRRGELANAFDAMLRANNGKLFALQDAVPAPLGYWVYDVATSLGNKAAQATANLKSKVAPAELILVGDLNWSIKGSFYNHIGFTQTTDKNEAVKDIIAVKGGSNPEKIKYINGCNYYLIGDANATVAPADRIWLYYTRQNLAGSTRKPIWDIYLERAGDTEFMDYPENKGASWERVKYMSGGDVNMNCGTNNSKILCMWVCR